MTNVDRVTEIVRRLGEFDFDGVAELLSPTFIQEYPYLPTPASPSRIEGPAHFLEFCRAGMTSFAPYAFRVDAIYETTDLQLVIAEYSSHTHLLDTTAPYSNRYVGIFRFDEHNKLALWREYLNPQVIADVFGP